MTAQIEDRALDAFNEDNVLVKIPRHAQVADTHGPELPAELPTRSAPPPTPTPARHPGTSGSFDGF